MILIGFMLRSDQLGVTSIIRDLALRADCYETMIHFFRASSWSVDGIRQRWFETVLKFAPLYKVNNYTILIGDGVKQAKDGRFMPGVKKLFQESENSSKPEYIFGHMFGGLGVLAGSIAKWFCIPLDRYFLSVPALKRLAELNAAGSVRMDLVTKAKKSCRAYEQPPAKKSGRGRPPKKGTMVKLKELFQAKEPEFCEATEYLYGKQEKIRYYCINLLWGQKLYQELRFVLAEYRGVQSILVSTCLDLDPVEIIRLYSYRFKNESMFRELKQQAGAFCYHFWTKAMPKPSP